MDEKFLMRPLKQERYYVNRMWACAENICVHRIKFLFTVLPADAARDYAVRILHAEHDLTVTAQGGYMR